jgi:hypothetical protein
VIQRPHLVRLRDILENIDAVAEMMDCGPLAAGVASNRSCHERQGQMMRRHAAVGWERPAGPSCVEQFP